MATLTKAELRDRVLEHLGVKAASQPATGHDSVLVDEAIDSAHDKLSARGLAPFVLSAIPAWAQPALRDYVAAEVSQSFGRPVDKAGAQLMAERELSIQLAGIRQLPVRATYY